jgi:hypothetical protein
MQRVWSHARSGREFGSKSPIRGEVAPVRQRDRVIAYRRAAEPDIQSMRGKDQRGESGSTCRRNLQRNQPVSFAR